MDPATGGTLCRTEAMADTAAGGGGDGRWQLMGGTGKYAGVTGTCTYDTSYLTQERVVTEAKCAWERS